MAKFLLSWETVYCEDYDTRGTAIVEAETAEQAVKEYEATHRMTVVSDVTEDFEEEGSEDKEDV